MTNKVLTLFTIALLLGLSQHTVAQNFKISSRDNQTTINVNVDKQITWSVTKYGVEVLPEVKIDMSVDGKPLAENPKILSNKTITYNAPITAVVPHKSKEIQDVYNELQLKFKGGFGLQFRVYDEGVAYRFHTKKRGEIEINSETLDITFRSGTRSLFPEEKSMYSHYERLYLDKKLDSIASGQFCSLPVMFNTTDAIRILYSEADTYDYPHMFLQGNSSNKLSALFPKAVAEIKPQPGRRVDRNVIITKEHSYIAKTNGTRTFPWRFFVISNEDKTFIEQDMVFKLSSPLAIENTNWIKPGKVAWDWWNANNIYGVDFESGLNTATYKYYIDFASAYNIEYVILDEGWTKSTTEILGFNPDIDVKELIRYGKEKGVGIILWCLWKPLDENMTEILDTYAGWGAKGVKVDFMQRADQYMVNSYTEIARECAKRELLVDYHGAFKPAGLRRAYPNVLSYEGVRGNEHNKWANYITPEHNLTLPFIRMAVGPMDYTPGAMRNAQEKNHSINFERPISLGTRAHQVSMYVIFESSLQMLCDAPSAYQKDEHTARFISQIPTIWDETKALHARLGEYLAIARKNGDNWYVGAMNNWKARTLDIDFSFLPEGDFEMTIFKDGANANRYAEDYKIEKINVDRNTRKTINLAKGGGWTAILKKR
ncbi:glycoside hydrolase family 97 protein [Snuella lapsa]